MQEMVCGIACELVTNATSTESHKHVLINKPGRVPHELVAAFMDAVVTYIFTVHNNSTSLHPSHSVRVLLCLGAKVLLSGHDERLG